VKLTCSNLCVQPVTSTIGSSNRDSLEARILASRERLTVKQQRLAQLLLGDVLYVAFASAEEVGRRTGVDAATVVRFSQLLGYEGYADLRDEIRGSVPQFLTALQKVSRAVTESRKPSDLMAEVFAQDIRNIEETASLNPPETLQAAVDVIDVSKRVFVLGSGMTAYVAEGLAHQLALVGVPVQRPPRTFAEASVDVASAGESDAVIMIALWRYLRDPVRLFEVTRDGGAATIALTDSKLSPLTGLADVLLVASTETPELSHSVTAIISVANALATGVALARPKRTLERLRAVDAVYDRIEAI
jgi:DNA-binding MurR/RpiR family transcriptional regulator